MDNIQEIYLSPARYNPHIHAIVPAAWVALLTDEHECWICPGFDANSADEANSIFNLREEK